MGMHDYLRVTLQLRKVGWQDILHGGKEYIAIYEFVIFMIEFACVVPCLCCGVIACGALLVCVACITISCTVS